MRYTPVVNEKKQSALLKFYNLKVLTYISIRTCELPFSDLNPNTYNINIVFFLKSRALLSLGQLCNDNCVIF